VAQTSSVQSETIFFLFSDDNLCSQCTNVKMSITGQRNASCFGAILNCSIIRLVVLKFSSVTTQVFLQIGLLSYSQAFHGKLGIHFTDNLVFCTGNYFLDVEPSSESDGEPTKQNAARTGDDNLEEEMEETEDVFVRSSWRKRKREVAHRGDDDESDEMDTETDGSWRRKRKAARRGGDGQSEEEEKMSMTDSSWRMQKRSKLAHGEEEEESEETEKISRSSWKRHKKMSESSQSRHTSDSMEDTCERMSSNNRRGASGVVVTNDEADGTDTEETNKHNVTDSKSARRRAGVRLKWSAEELKLLRSEFRQFFKLKKLPDENSIRRAVSRHAVLGRRTAPQIKSRRYFIQTGR
jgi:hypothetical protein